MHEREVPNERMIRSLTIFNSVALTTFVLAATIARGQDSVEVTETTLLEQVYKNRIAMMQDSLFIMRERLQAAEFLTGEINNSVVEVRDSLNLARTESALWADSLQMTRSISRQQRDQMGQNSARINALNDSLALSYVREQGMSDLNDSLMVLLGRAQDFLTSSGQIEGQAADSLNALRRTLDRLQRNMMSNETSMSTQLAKIQSNMVMQEGLSVDTVLDFRNLKYLTSLVSYEIQKSGFGRFLGGGDDELAEFKQAELSLYLSQSRQRGEADQALLMLADQYGENGDVPRAALAYLKVIFLYPDRPSWAVARTNIVGLIDRDSEEGYLLYEVALVPDSMEVSKDPLYRTLHYLDYLQHLTSKAGLLWLIDECRMFLSLYPGALQTDQIIYMMADAYRGLELYHEATLTYEKLMTLYPRSARIPEAMLTTARLSSIDLELPKKGVERYQEYLDLFPNNREAPGAALAQAVLYEEELKDYHQAGELYRKLADDYPDDHEAPIALFRYGRLLEGRLGSPTGATVIFEEILERFGDEPDHGIPALKQLAAIAMVLEQYDAAVVYHLDVSQRYPESSEQAVEAILAAAEIYRSELDNLDAAIHTLHMVLDNYPQYPGIKSVRKQVVKLQKKRG